jgi:hypothetical protein
VTNQPKQQLATELEGHSTYQQPLASDTSEETKMKLRLILFLCLGSLCSNALAFFTCPSTQHRSSAFLNSPNLRKFHPVKASRASIETSSNAFGILQDAQVIDPSTGKQCRALDGIVKKNDPAGWLQDALGNGNKKALVVVMPQLGDFDSAEYAEMLSAVEEDLKKSNIDLRIIAIGDENSAKKFAKFNNLKLNNIRIDPEGEVHRALNLHAGPNWDIPSLVPNGVLEWFADYCGAKGDDRDVDAIARAWVNYMLMCAGIGAPDTLPEIFRGYVGDKNAPERIRPDEVVTVGDKHDPFIAITGVSDVKLGPFEYQQLWRNESGYQRPVELATVRLRVMVEVITNFNEYVPDQRFLDLRGATFLFDEDNELLYEHIDTGVLSYSKTMARPLTFLEPFIGKKALNPLELADTGA